MNWFDRLPIHRKLVAIALFVTTVALILATSGLILLDVLSYRVTAERDTTALASVIAENTAAAVMFREPRDAEVLLSAVRTRSNVNHACIYLPDRTLFAGFGRDPANACPGTENTRSGWSLVTGSAAVVWDGQALGHVYVERQLTELWSRAAVALAAGFGLLLLATGLAFVMASRLHRTTSRPIVQLVEAMRLVDTDDPSPVLPHIDAGLDEVGALVKACADMLGRVGHANEALRRKETELAVLLEREREASRLKDEFLATVSHELRTPLNAIVGWTHILTTAIVDDATRRRALESITRNAHAQARVIEDLVDVSRIVTGKLHLQFSPVDVRSAIEGAVEAVRPTAEARGVHLLLNLGVTPAIVRGDLDRLQQVVWNLLSNAVKFTAAEGTVWVELMLYDGVYEIEVRDTGVGIPPAFLPFVFDRFRQADGSTTRSHSGLGLGLAIVKELAELHGGCVGVTSQGMSQGSRFSVRLPAFEGPAEASARRVTSDHPSSRALDGVSILVVDDNEDALDVLSASLATAGAHVRTASSGAEALANWKSEPAQLLLCDVAMPHIDGIEVLRRIRETDAHHGRVTPAVALSAHASDDHVARSMEAGFVSHLTKPYVAADLIRVLRDALEIRP